MTPSTQQESAESLTFGFTDKDQVGTKVKAEGGIYGAQGYSGLQE